MKHAPDYRRYLKYTPEHRAMIFAVIRSSGIEVAARREDTGYGHIQKLFKVDRSKFLEQKIFDIGMMYAEGLSMGSISDITGLDREGVRRNIEAYKERAIGMHEKRMWAHTKSKRI